MPRPKRLVPIDPPAAELPLDSVILGDCLEVMRSLPSSSIDLVFADPPYNLQLRHTLTRPNLSVVDGVDDLWDRFASPADYDRFTEAWLRECRRLLSDTGTLWVIGSYHNIFRVGRIMADLGYWVLNDVIWHKTNPMPNFRGTRFQNATETLIWAQKSKEQKRYVFNYHTMKNLNEGKQMTNVWYIPLCKGPERLQKDGEKLHSTQKPEELLYRVILSSTNAGGVVLDPFFGSGTTGAVARRLKRHFIGIENDPNYVVAARARIDQVIPAAMPDELLTTPSRRDQPQVRFGDLIAAGLIGPGSRLRSRNGRHEAVVKADSCLLSGSHLGSIHRVGALVQGAEACNGWDFWHFTDTDGRLHSIDALRQRHIHTLSHVAD
ncbi:DNA methyltransferase CcrM [uncultured Gammaproteobacteria bacterium]